MRTEPDINTNRHQHQQQNTYNLNAMFDNQHETPSINFSPISKPEPSDSGRFFRFGSFDIGPPISPESTYSDNDDNVAGATGIAEEARYNLATRVMSNGVEVIIAGDKNGKESHKPNALRVLPSLSRKPMTLAPSTLKDQMILVMPSNVQENYTIPINSNHFITKTCLTTYTYRTTYLQNGITTVESREKVVSNTATEERNYLEINPTESLGVTLSKTPELAVGVFHTTYTYFNTILDGDLPLVVSSQHVLTNTITGPDDYISFLQPSEEATPVLETNTYFSKISLTKTIKESDIEQIVSTSNILTQVIVTESLPPRSTAVMTSYIAFDSDETNIQDRSNGSILKKSDRSTTDVIKTQFHTYYNGEQNENDSTQLQLHENTASQLADSEHLTSVPKPHAPLQTDMHIYATKTYLTTFTYYTTLMNTQGNVESSTIVNFHTRVIENVIKESIPSFIINSDLLYKFESELKNPKNHNSYSTMVTLAGGQPLEITAMNMLQPSPTSSKTQTKKVDSLEKNDSAKLQSSVTVSNASLASITPPPVENSSEILDSDTASSENEELLAEPYITAESETIIPKNSTKTTGTTDFPSVNQIIESLNLNRLQALGPVFNAMAGLIQNNFGTSLSNDLKKNVSVLNIESKHSAKNISAYDSAQVHDGPIYIPVQGLHGNNQNGNPANIKLAGYISPQSLHISPPETDWFLEEKKNHGKLEISPGKPTYETPLLNGGIPISPGEVITANSDVIVGKPNGVQPRVPFNNKNQEAGNAFLPPLPGSPFSYQFQYQKHPKQTKANPSPIPLEVNYEKPNFDAILKPPPLKLPPLQHQQQKKTPSHNVFNSNYRIHYATGHMQSHQHIPMQHAPQQGLQQHHPQRHNVQRPYNTGFQVSNNPRPVSQKPNYIPYAPHDYDQPHHQVDTKNEFDLNQDLHNNEILEIKRIPEVYSTDLPGTESGANISIGNGGYKTLVKKVINSDKPMLVDIQPSQITNIVIPRDNSASILIVESAVELHKNGQYYDEPTTYPDAIVTGSIAPPIRKPILSNQQVNLNMSVLSHNVDINVPPITFNKDTDFPHSTPVRGQIQKNEPANFQMPHVTIPITDNQIQVKLTPQNVITQQLHRQPFIEVEPLNGSNNVAGDTLQNLEASHYKKKTPVNTHSHPVQQIYQHSLSEVRTRPIYSNLPFEQIHRPVHGLKGIESSSAFSVPQFIGVSNKNKPILQVIPIGNGNILPPERTHSNFPKIPYSHQPGLQQKEILKIFANVTTPKQVDDLQSRPTVNPVPLLNLFYGAHNNGEEDLSGDFSQGPTQHRDKNYWQPNTIHQDDEDNDPIEDSNKIEDQKASPSLSVGIPTQNQAVSEKPSTTAQVNISESLEVFKPKEEYKIRTTQASSSSPKQRPNPKFETTIRPETTSITEFPPKSPIIGMESYLDSASVNAVNNMGELDIQLPLPPPSSPHILNKVRTPSQGKPFKQTKPNTRPPKRNNNDQKIFINSGEGFKLQHDHDENQADFGQPSLSVDTKEVYANQKDGSTQTETPFNPKYTKSTKKPPKVSQSAVIIGPKSPPKLSLNKMEMVNTSKNNLSSYHYHVKESAEIFDFHESINPHNFDFVHIPTDESSILNESIYISDIITQKPGLTNLYPFVSEPSGDMKPPPMSTLPQTENVMGLNPPPPPTISVSLAPVSMPPFTPSMVPSVTTYKTINITVTNRNPLLHPAHTTVRPPKIPLHPPRLPPSSKYNPTTSRPRTKPTFPTQSRVPSSAIFKRKPVHAQSKPTKDPNSPTSITPIIYISPSDPFASIKASSTAPPLSTSLLSTTIIENTTATVMMPELEIYPTLSTDMQRSSNAPKKTIKPIYNDAKNGGSYEIPIFTLDQKISDEIVTEQSEEDRRQRPTTRVLENQTRTATMGAEHPIITDDQLEQSQTQPHLNRINTRTRITSRIIPTKYVTNTQILTVTTTKISVVTRLGIPSTQTFTLTKTKTSTLVDTVTETHTLLQPTRVTESHTPTATQILQTDYYATSNIQPTVVILQPSVSRKQPPEQSILIVPLTPRAPTTTPNTARDIENNSIFVVMTDKKSHGGVFSISPSMIDTPQNINAIGSAGSTPENENSIELDYDDNITFDLPTRDEEAETNEVNHVLLGGVLIATPPKASDSSHLGVVATSCRPPCKASRNELCQQDDTRMLCVCRPGFARMFPDRPCRPTYTYAMQIPIHRISKEILHFKEQYRVRDSEDFKQLAGITHDAVDRMVMQSDLRDVYHGVHVTSFDAPNTETGILGKFLIQLSDNSDENRLVDVFKKYLRQNNFSLGGTDIFTTQNGVNSLEIVDFDECAHSQFHDCSENSRCFNLQGTYTCSCQEGYADLSENSIYPGRICSAEIIGCEKCHYHGKCIQTGKTIAPVCECFHWYAGASCQLNLKILLIALIAVGTILFILLLFCLLVTCTRRRKNHNMQSLMSGIHIIGPRNTRLSTKNLTTDKRAMIKDSSSETSQNSLPYILKKDSKKLASIQYKNYSHQSAPQEHQTPFRNVNSRNHPSSAIVSSLTEMDHRHNYSEQNDRSLTVMIPRAKYHHSVITQTTSNTEPHDHAGHCNDTQHKPSPTENLPKGSSFHTEKQIHSTSLKTISMSSSNHGALHTTSTGALVSAGYEVSATVGNIVSQQMGTLNSTANALSSHENRASQMPKLIDEFDSRKSNYQDGHLQFNTYKEGEKFIDSMDVWLDTIQQNELTAEARSFDETTIQAPTKSLRSVYERQMSQSNGNDEANTMAERDIGSTFLLPHTHLYKPDRDSDVSGFDSF